MRTVPVGELLKEEMKERGLTPADLALESGLDLAVIAALFDGGPITPEASEKIGTVLGLDSRFLLRFDALHTRGKFLEEREPD